MAVVAVAATTVGATAAMTDLPVSESTGPTAAERLAALRKPTEQRGKPAHTTKIFAAGISTMALFAMVAAMGWPSGTESTQSASLQTTTTPVVPLVTPTPVPPITVPATRATVPAIPVTTAPVVIPTATPVEQSPVQNASVRTASNTVTKSSG